MSHTFTGRYQKMIIKLLPANGYSTVYATKLLIFSKFQGAYLLKKVKQTESIVPRG